MKALNSIGLEAIVLATVATSTLSQPSCYAVPVTVEYTQTCQKLEASNKPREALAYLQQILKKNPNDLAALWNLVRIMGCKGHGEEQLENCNRLLKADPECKRFPFIYNFRAMAYRDMDECEKALPDLDKSQTLGQDNEASYLCRAQCLQTLGRTKEAIAAYTTIIERFKVKQSYPYIGRATSYEAFNLPEKALLDWNKALELEPDNCNSLTSRARVLERLHKYGDAAGDYSRILRLHPNDETIYYLRGKAYFADGKYKLALTDLTKSINMDSIPSASVFELRAKIHDKLGESELAKKDRASAAAATAKMR